MAGWSRKQPPVHSFPHFRMRRIYVQKENLKWARNPTDKDRASYLKQDWEAIVANGMLEELDGPGELFPGISIRIFNGHTRAQQLPLISDGTNSVFFCADLFPTKAHINLPWIMGYDNFPLTTLEEKRALLPELSKMVGIFFLNMTRLIHLSVLNRPRRDLGLQQQRKIRKLFLLFNSLTKYEQFRNNLVIPLDCSL